MAVEAAERGDVKPLCYDLYCGLGGWAEGFLAEGWNVVGFDIERHEYGEMKEDYLLDAGNGGVL